MVQEPGQAGATIDQEKLTTVILDEINDFIDPARRVAGRVLLLGKPVGLPPAR